MESLETLLEETSASPWGPRAEKRRVGSVRPFAEVRTGRRSDPAPTALPRPAPWSCPELKGVTCVRYRAEARRGCFSGIQRRCGSRGLARSGVGSLFARAKTGRPLVCREEDPRRMTGRERWRS